MCILIFFNYKYIVVYILIIDIVVSRLTSGGVITVRVVYRLYFIGMHGLMIAYMGKKIYICKALIDQALRYKKRAL